jgi:hypothetical protein
MAIRGKGIRVFEAALSFCIQYTKRFFCQEEIKSLPAQLIFVYDSGSEIQSFPLTGPERGL